MEIKITVSLSEEDRKCLNGIADALNSVKVTTDTGKAPKPSATKPAPEKAPAKPAKGKGKGQPATIEDEDPLGLGEDEDLDGGDLDDLDREDEDELGADDDADELGEDEAADDEPEAEEVIDKKQHAQLTKALNTHKGKHGKAKTLGILKKYAEASDKVKAADFAKLMKALKV